MTIKKFEALNFLGRKQEKQKPETMPENDKKKILNNQELKS